MFLLNGANGKTGTYLSSFNQEWSFTWDSVALPLYATLTFCSAYASGAI
jgi:hypothetical protein